MRTQEKELSEKIATLRTSHQALEESLQSTLKTFRQDMVDSVSDSLDESVEAIRGNLETTLKTLDEDEKRFFKEHSSKIYEIKVYTSDINLSVKKWKKLIFYNFYLELMIAIAIIAIAIKIF